MMLKQAGRLFRYFAYKQFSFKRWLSGQSKDELITLKSNRDLLRRDGFADYIVEAHIRYTIDELLRAK